MLCRDLLEKDKIRLVLEWFQENPSKTTTIAARIYYITKPNSLSRAWKRERTRGAIQHNSQNKILRPD
jgi:hypothetical protein